MPRLTGLPSLTVRAPRSPWLSCLAAGLSFLVYLIPLPGPVDPAGGIPLARYLGADHELTTGRSGIPGVPLPAAVAERPPDPRAFALFERWRAGPAPTPPSRAPLGRVPVRSPPTN
jgi:hypothetical protein